MTEEEREELLKAMETWSKWGSLFTSSTNGSYTAIDSSLRAPFKDLWPDIYDEGYKAGRKSLRAKFGTPFMWNLGIAFIWMVNIINALNLMFPTHS